MSNKLKKHPYGLGIVLFTLWIVTWALHGAGEYWSSTFAEHEIPWQVDYFTTTFENWQSEVGQVFLLITLTSILIFKGSPESKDGDERMEEKMDVLLREVGKLRTDMYYLRRNERRTLK